MSQPTKFNWKKLTHFQPKYFPYKILFQEESNLLIAVPFSIPTNADNKNQYIIYKYLFYNNSWKEYNIEPPKQFNKQRRIYPKAINKGYIYANTQKHEIAMITLIEETNKYKIKIIRKMHKTKEYAYGKSIIIEDEYHYISSKHTKYNLKTQEYVKLGTPANKIHNDNYRLFQLKHKLFTIIQNIKDSSYCIYQYDLEKNCSKSFSINLLKSIRIISCTPILDNKILISTTPRKTPYNNTQCAIYVYEIQTEIIKKSNITFPQTYEHEIFAINDKRRDILLTYGWINNQCKNTYIPVCLKALVRQYYTVEYLHAFNRNNEHYKIDVFHILDNC